MSIYGFPMTIPTQIKSMIHRLTITLLRCLVSFRTAHAILKDEGPPAISEYINVVGKVSDQFIEDVRNLRRNSDQRIDLSSPIRAAGQIRHLASGWREYEALLSDAIRRMLESGVRIKDEELDNIMQKVLPAILEDLKQEITLLETVEAQFLITLGVSWTDILVQSCEEKDMLVKANVYRLFHKLLNPLKILWEAYAMLNDQVPSEITEPIGIIGRTTNQFIEDVLDLRGHLTPPGIDLSSLDEAAAQIHHQASDWREYEALLSDAVRQIAVSKVRIGDESLDTIMDTLPELMGELAQMMRFLETIEAKHLTVSDVTMLIGEQD